jgi:hypothetical protein
MPEAVQQATAIWVQILWYQSQRDPALRGQSVHGTITQSWGADPTSMQLAQSPPAQILPLLAPYKRLTVTTNQA